LLARKGELDQAYRSILDTLKQSATAFGTHHEQHAYNLSTLGMLQTSRGRLPEAAKAFDKARHLFRAAQGDNGFGFEDNTARLAGVFASQGRIQKAIDLLDEALARFERKLTARFPPVVDLRLNKADLLTRLDQPEAAAAAAQRAFEDAQHIHPPHHPRIVYAASRLADKMSGVGRIIVARTLISDALKSAARRGRETPEYANLLLMSASVQFVTSDIPSAVSTAQRALGIAERLLPPQHPALVSYLLSLSRFQQAAGALDKSVRLGERALDIVQSSQQLKGADPTILANMLSRLSEVYAEQGLYAKAEPAMRRALNIYRDIYTPNHTVIQGALYQLIGQFYARGRYSEGLSLTRRVLKSVEERYGRGHLHTSNFLVSMAVGLTHLGQVAEAEQYFLKWEAIADRGMPPPQLVFGLTNFGEFRRRTGQADQALKLLDRAVALADRHQLVPKAAGPARVFQATLLLEKGQNRKAEMSLRKMHAFYTQTLGEQSFQAIGIRRLIAEAVANQGRYQEADVMVQDALADLEAKVGPDSTMLRDTLQVQRAVYERWNKPDRQAAVEARLDALPPEGSRHLRLLYATNRTLRQGGKGYGSRVAKSLGFGVSRVKVPESEVTHQSERRANSLGQLHAADGRLAETEKLAILETVATDRDRFIAHVNKAARRATRFTGQVLVFVHGYNNDFEDAMLRASQIAFDLDFDGPVVAFAWPSRGSFLRYGADERAAAEAPPYLAELLT
ncbi:MAG: tetratricopeptide repeat protein, partial [Pseudomonadota bacterium]